MRIDTVTDAGLETWVAHDELSRLELVPARGGLITRWVADGDELLFLDRSTLVDLSKNARRHSTALPFPRSPAELVDAAAAWLRPALAVGHGGLYRERRARAPRV